MFVPPGVVQRIVEPAVMFEPVIVMEAASVPATAADGLLREIVKGEIVNGTRFESAPVKSVI